MSADIIVWETDAKDKMEKAPFFIRSFAKRKVEKAAIAQGLKIITVDFVEQIQQKEMSN